MDVKGNPNRNRFDYWVEEPSLRSLSLTVDLRLSSAGREVYRHTQTHDSYLDEQEVFLRDVNVFDIKTPTKVLVGVSTRKDLKGLDDSCTLVSPYTFRGDKRKVDQRRLALN